LDLIVEGISFVRQEIKRRRLTILQSGSKCKTSFLASRLLGDGVSEDDELIIGPRIRIADGRLWTFGRHDSRVREDCLTSIHSSFVGSGGFDSKEMVV
jgi:hypothetical protein